jgi:NAD(P)-dependent dehydrogenase (short-subunit alcohol dehydrogenase family)
MNDVTRNVLDLLRLDGKIALVTGGSRGLGLQIAEGLGEAGATIAIMARKAAGLAEAEEHLRDRGIHTLAVACDISQPAQVQAAVRQVTNGLGSIDILVNNAGATWGAPLDQITPDSWEKVIRTNLHGTFSVTNAVTLDMLARGAGGRIIIIGSIAGLKGTDPRILQTLAYNTSKGGLVEFTRSLAHDLVDYGITVNCICPGFFPTKLAAVTIENARDLILERTPLRRVGGPDDLKGISVLLASAASAGITGQVIAVDGGMSIV